MSQSYQNLPPTSAKVVLNTTVGDIDVELWTKEAPLACRNFVQLCLEGYYDNSMFHRVIPKFMVQGGDPTGTGQGGESIYGAPFKDEIHSRLRFGLRGLLAMANGGKDDNSSQFFLTLAPCEWLNGKHTIFGKVTGKTIYNLDAMGEYECDDNDRPLYPPRIVTTEVLLHPFDDIVPRDLKAKKESEDGSKPKQKPKKNKALLSFGNDEEAPGIQEDEGEAEGGKKKMVSAHDVLNDAKLSKEPLPSRSREELEADEREAREAAGIVSEDEEEEDDSEEDEDVSKKSADRRKEQYISVKSSKLKMLEGIRDEEADDEDDSKVKEREQRKREMEKLKKDILSMKKGARAVKLGQESTGTNKDVDLLQGIEKARALHKSRKRVGSEREKETLAKLNSFKSGVLKGAEGDDKGEPKVAEREYTHVGSYGWQEALDDYDDSDWLSGGGLTFQKESKVSFLQRQMEDDDSLATYDPLADKRPKNKEDPFAGSRPKEESGLAKGRDREHSRPESYGDNDMAKFGGKRDDRDKSKKGGDGDGGRDDRGKDKDKGKSNRERERSREREREKPKDSRQRERSKERDRKKDRDRSKERERDGSRGYGR